MINKHNGMTLAEIIIALGIIGVLAAVSIPQINKVKPNQEMIKFKKAYAITTRLAKELVLDDELYPDISDSPLNSGFSNIDYVADVHGIRYSGDQKFCRLFASRMQTKGSVDCSNSGYGEEAKEAEGADYFFTYYEQDFTPNFTTVDGIQWGLPVNSFNAGEEDSTQYIALDVNGSSGNNCFHEQVLSYDDDGNKTNCAEPDRFLMKINRSGDVWVDGPVEKYYLESTKTTKSYKQILKEIKTDEED